MEKITIGWQEYLSLPDLKIPSIAVKVDTGAKTSALHVQDLEPISHKKPQRGSHIDKVRFRVCLRQHDNPNGIPSQFQQFRPDSTSEFPANDIIAISPVIEYPVVDYRSVTSSNGTPEDRYVIETVIMLGRHHWKTEITLANRNSMGFGMLLGRRAMESRVTVDPSKSYLCAQPSPLSVS
ncbi:MAG: RimK/LysX family protein [Cyanobacteria bacterium P01_C01_bin.89]